jgi:DNA-binding transcriptional regulator YiaG
VDHHEIRELRKRLGLTQTEMAERLGVHLRTYQQWEYDRRQPRRPTLKLLQLLKDEADKTENP